MIRELTKEEKDIRLKSIEEDIDPRKPFYENPANKALTVCGAMRGLEVPMESICALARAFSEATIFILSRNQQDPRCSMLLEAQASASSDVLRREIYSGFPEIFSDDLVVCWGGSEQWYILFSPQLSLGVLLVRMPCYLGIARDAYSEGDDLIEITEAFYECTHDELQHLPKSLDNQLVAKLFSSWRVPIGSDEKLS